MQKERQLEPKGHQTSLPSPTAHALIPVESEGLRVEAMPGISSVESERKAPPFTSKVKMLDLKKSSDELKRTTLLKCDEKSRVRFSTDE